MLFTDLVNRGPLKAFNGTKCSFSTNLVSSRTFRRFLFPSFLPWTFFPASYSKIALAFDSKEKRGQPKQFCSEYAMFAINHN